ncbi:hypothetical protein FRC02_004050 [Tulasnella sp. 418]|nr:hypothetical protein FRC02_004050 [Tulasnella sp. 418]
MKTDHPVIDSRHLIHEAAQAHYYGLHPALALSSVTRIPAEVAGLDHRLGHIREKFDADLVIWDSHPLALGATPRQVYIDGIPQIKDPHPLNKPQTYQAIPRTPNFNDEAKKAIEYEGLVPLEPASSVNEEETIVFTNVKSLWKKKDQTSEVIDVLNDSSATGVVLVRRGKVGWAGSELASVDVVNAISGKTRVVDLEGGSIAPGLTSFGSPLGLEEIEAEPATNDGAIDPTEHDFVIKAKDGISLGGRHLLLAYRSGVTSAITAPVSSSYIGGLSTCFRTGSMSVLEDGAMIQDVVAVHATVGRISVYNEALDKGTKTSISTQIGMLRSLLLGRQKTELGEWYRRVAMGETPLVINVAKADYMAALINLKQEIESHTLTKMRMVFGVATEAHLIADKIAEAGIGVVLLPPRPSRMVWDMRRMLPGPPLSQDTQVTKLLRAGVLVGIGILETVFARNTRFDLAWTAMDANGSLSESETMALASSNIDKMLGVERSGSDLVGDLVVYHGGGIFDLSSKVVGVISERRAMVDLF